MDSPASDHQVSCVLELGFQVAVEAHVRDFCQEDSTQTEPISPLGNDLAWELLMRGGGLCIPEQAHDVTGTPVAVEDQG